MRKLQLTVLKDFTVIVLIQIAYIINYLLMLPLLVLYAVISKPSEFLEVLDKWSKAIINRSFLN